MENKNIHTVTLRPGEERRLKRGHLWVFSNEIAETSGEIPNGSLIELKNDKGVFLGRGFYNKNSLIAVRILSLDKIENIEEHLSLKIAAADSLRTLISGSRNAYRMVFGESDFLPGLIADRYNDTYVLQINSAGMELLKHTIVKILVEKFNARNIFTASDEAFRSLEGLPPANEVLHGSMENETINDGYLNYLIDFEKSQKTGFFFDQVENRAFIQRFCNGMEVLDAYCNSGGFGMHALRGGARFVTFVDSSLNEMQNVESNLALNGFDESKCAELIHGDVFEYFLTCREGGKQFDVVMIDPPAFIKSRKSIASGIKGYEKLHRLALEALRPGGIFVSTSCSHHLSQNDFIESVVTAAVKSGTTLQLLHFSSAGHDHPSLPSMPETTYLKFAVFRKA